MPGGKLADKFLLERYEKDIQYIKVYDQYTPNYNETAITPKFYSKYESGELEKVSPKILESIIYARDVCPKEKMEWPITTNQMYGWWTTPFVETDRNDPRFYFPRIGNEITKIGLKILADNKKPKKK